MGKFFQFNIKRVCNAIDVVEKGNDLRCIMNSLIIKTYSSQLLDIIFEHLGWAFGQFLRISAQRTIGRG
ncbi:MAG: hypothetical protein ACI9EW_000955 [Cellvibrionaceae bacterium]|jgi:hypothetical protein